MKKRNRLILCFFFAFLTLLVTNIFETNVRAAYIPDSYIRNAIAVEWNKTYTLNAHSEDDVWYFKVPDSVDFTVSVSGLPKDFGLFLECREYVKKGTSPDIDGDWDMHCTDVLTLYASTSSYTHNSENTKCEYLSFCVEQNDEDAAYVPVSVTFTMKDMPVFTWNGLTCSATINGEAIPDLIITDSVTKESTCSEQGIHTYTATVYWEEKLYTNKKEIAIPTVAHTEEKDEAEPATCAKPGKTEGSHCSVCNKIIVAQKEIPTIAHTIEENKGTEATCTTPGMTNGSHCSVCGTIIEAQKVIPASHIWDEEVIDGKKIYTCRRCGEIKKEDTENQNGNQNPSQDQPKKVGSIILSGISKQIAAGKKIKLTAEVLPLDAANKTLTWASSNTKVATVAADGTVTILKNSAGKSVTITASAKDGSGVKAIYVIKSMKGIVKKITVSGSKTAKAGKSIKLKAKVTVTKGANKTITWVSSNPALATVSKKGVVKIAKSAKGKTISITAMATDGSGKKKVFKIKVK